MNISRYTSTFLLKILIVEHFNLSLAIYRMVIVLTKCRIWLPLPPLSATQSSVVTKGVNFDSCIMVKRWKQPSLWSSLMYQGQASLCWTWWRCKNKHSDAEIWQPLNLAIGNPHPGWKWLILLFDLSLLGYSIFSINYCLWDTQYYERGWWSPLFEW